MGGCLPESAETECGAAEQLKERGDVFLLPFNGVDICSSAAD